ncbi:MAG: hypothetical protein DWQ37_21910 [Planctomycetota bacterium]|nr:MAG: hypothetical protein DWQ37_21910 [Planctomycetota bacterium]
MSRAVLLAIVVAVGGMVSADTAQAFHRHRVRTTCIAYYPGLYSFPACCGCTYPPYTYGCSYAFPKFCGARRACWPGYLTCSRSYGPYGYSCGGCAPCGYSCGGYGCGSCGYGDCGMGCGSCGSCGMGCGDCGMGCGSCGGCGSCDGGCVGGSCGGSGCVGCDSGYSSAGGSYESDEKVIYDGPAPGPGASEVPPPEPDPSASNSRNNFHLTSARSASQDASQAFARGLQSYRNGNLGDAQMAFGAATAADPDNALYLYHQALVAYDQYGAEAANDWLARAIDAERESPVKNWGRRMERVQGQVRLWIEQARRQAGLRR